MTTLGAARGATPPARPAGWRALLWPIIAVLPVLAMLLSLGVWQVRRLEWKTALLTALDASEQGPPTPLGSTTPPAYTKLVATGRFDHTREALLALEVRGATLGAHLLTPLLRADLPAVLVDRGWVPLERSIPVERPEGERTVIGWARAPEPRGDMAARDDTAGRHFYTFDPVTIGAALGVPQPQAFALVALGAPTATPPTPQQRVPRPNNPHLGYAITWFGLAAALLGVFAAFAWRRLRNSS